MEGREKQKDWEVEEVGLQCRVMAASVDSTGSRVRVALN